MQSTYALRAASVENRNQKRKRLPFPVHLMRTEMLASNLPRPDGWMDIDRYYIALTRNGRGIYLIKRTINDLQFQGGPSDDLAKCELRRTHQRPPYHLWGALASYCNVTLGYVLEGVRPVVRPTRPNRIELNR